MTAYRERRWRILNLDDVPMVVTVHPWNEITILPGGFLDGMPLSIRMKNGVTPAYDLFEIPLPVSGSIA